jgi:long-chain acyl-CoA synthetase
MFQESIHRYGNDPCVSYKDGGRYRSISYTELGGLVRNLALYLIEAGINKGDKVALFSPNRYEWWLADLAILSIGAVNVPIYATDSADEAGYIMKNSDAVFLVAGTSKHLSKGLKGTSHVLGALVFDEVADLPHGAITLSTALAKGAGNPDPTDFDRRLAAVQASDLATIIYTSGTTGDPKGVMLSHSNLVANAKQSYLAIKSVFGHQRQTLLSFLPLSHAFERTVGYYMSVYTGSHVYFARSPVADLKQVRPTLLVSVPRIYEMVHAGILKQIAGSKGGKKILLGMAMHAARMNLPYMCGNKLRKGWFALYYHLADRLVFRKIKASIGLDRIDLCISGGGPLAVGDAEFFLGIGVRVVEGFGLSECSPVTNVNLPHRIKPGTVGPAYAETIEKISPDGELLIKGPQVMQGYYQNAKATQDAFTTDGYLKTGDIAEFDEDGFLKIIGRSKDIIITAAGKNISPQNIEGLFKDSPYINQICIIGDRRKFLSALIVPDFDNLKAWARKQGINHSLDQDLIHDENVRALYHQEFDHYNEKVAQPLRIMRFTLLKSEWTQETNELTPTQKIKRLVINEKYADIIERMYQEKER